MPKNWRYQSESNRQSSYGAFADPEVTAQYREAINNMIAAYDGLLAKGVCREQARGLLPVCTYTEFIFTCNLHSLINFLVARLHPGAQQEIQAYARGMLELALPHFPVSLEACKKKYKF